jgi:hypothetical protein
MEAPLRSRPTVSALGSVLRSSTFSLAVALLAAVVFALLLPLAG